jgi:hypothetical protein
MTIKNRKLPQIPDGLPMFLDEKQVARVSGLSLSFLRKSRSEGTRRNRTPAPPFVRIGGRVYYRRDDFFAWASELGGEGV